MNKFLHRDIPFPGTRCYRTTDSEFFFGRSIEINALKAKIRKERLVALVGHPNVGKTSLVQSGLRVALENRFSAKSGADWLIVELDSKKDLFQSLVEKLSTKGSKTIDPNIRLSPKFKKNIVETLSDKKDKGLVNIYKQSDYIRKHNLLIVVDHFEEVLENIDTRPNFNKITNLFRNAILDKSTSIYVLLVMHKRTYDTINKGNTRQYKMLKNLIRYPFYLHGMTESGLQEAIQKPIQKLNYKIHDSLCKELITDVIGLKTEKQLPALQTNLITIWKKWKEDLQEDVISIQHYKVPKPKAKPKPKPKKEKTLTFAAPPREKEPVKRKVEIKWDEIAEELYSKKLNGVQRATCSTIFQTILEPTEPKRFRAMPATIKELTVISDEPEHIVNAVVRLFNTKKLIKVSPQEALSMDSKVTPTASLLNSEWKRLEDWLEEEQLRVDYYNYLVETARNNTNLDEEERQQAKEWWDTNKIIEWALRYGSQADYDAVEAFFYPKQVVMTIPKAPEPTPVRMVEPERIVKPVNTIQPKRKKIKIKRK